MTEAEWLAYGDPGPMLEWLQGKVSDRKLRLFSVACCRRVWERLEEGGRHAVEVAERFADGEADAQQFKRARLISQESREPAGWGGEQACAWYTTDKFAWRAAEGAARASAGIFSRAWDLAARKADRTRSRVDRQAVGAIAQLEQAAASAAQADLLRDIFGNPVRPVTFSPDWQTDTAVSLARQMYESREFGAMPILADALQDAGCDNEDILTHCRGSGPHVRGCWVVDLVLGKE
jgi:hypothetical protein